MLTRISLINFCSHNMAKANNVQIEDGLERLVILENIVLPCMYKRFHVHTW
jgi:hypothetical protein